MKCRGSRDEISDGRRYDLNDMVKADTQGCAGCFDCCCGMGASVALTPLDVWRLEQATGSSFGELMSERIELCPVDGLLLPNLKMCGAGERCGFLGADGRCGIHPFRPDICRMFPLGRVYEDGTFHYFLQEHECRKEGRAKVKVKKWLDIPQLREHEQFIRDWHNYLERFEEKAASGRDGKETQDANMRLLQCFYIRPYDTGQDFYPQFYERFRMAEKNGKDK